MTLKGVIFIIIFILVVAAILGSFSGGSQRGGDGITRCKTCGKREVYKLGRCRYCYGQATGNYGHVPHDDILCEVSIP